MSVQTQEARIILAIEAIHTTKKLSRRKAAQIYNVPETSLRDRMNGITVKREDRNPRHILTFSEEQMLVRYILDMDARGFPPRISSVEDMANSLLQTRLAKSVGTRWAYRFVQRHHELKTRLTRAYDFQRALCEDPDQTNAWFRLVANMRTKYGIQDCDLYNFDETGFMMGIICSSMVVTHVDRRGRSKQLQPGNRE